MANEKVYQDQTWGSSYDISGEQLSVNARYCGQKKGTSMQDNNAIADVNADKYYVEHTAIRYGTIMQDSASNANMPVEALSVKYDANGGTGSISSQIYVGTALKVKDSTGLTAPNAKKFSKWNTKANGSGTDYNAGATLTPTSNMTLYAVWVDV